MMAQELRKLTADELAARVFGWRTSDRFGRRDFAQQGIG